MKKKNCFVFKTFLVRFFSSRKILKFFKEIFLKFLSKKVVFFLFTKKFFLKRHVLKKLFVVKARPSSASWKKRKKHLLTPTQNKALVKISARLKNLFSLLLLLLTRIKSGITLRYTFSPKFVETSSGGQGAGRPLEPLRKNATRGE